jgi:hypothetical protein
MRFPNLLLSVSIYSHLPFSKCQCSKLRWFCPNHAWIPLIYLCPNFASVPGIWPEPCTGSCWLVPKGGQLVLARTLPRFLSCGYMPKWPVGLSHNLVEKCQASGLLYAKGPVGPSHNWVEKCQTFFNHQLLFSFFLFTFLSIILFVRSVLGNEYGHIWRLSFSLNLFSLAGCRVPLCVPSHYCRALAWWG